MTQDSQNMYEDPSSLCTTGKPPLVVTGIIMQLLIRHFATADYIKTEQLKQYLWKPDSDDAQDQTMIIAPNYRIRWQNIQSRPAIIIKRNTITSRKLAIDDYFGPPEDEGDGDHFIRAKQGSHTIFCVSKNGTVAEMLGAEVSDELTEFSPLIRRDLDFGRFEEQSIGEVLQVEEHNTHFAVPITVAYVFTHSWKLTPIAPYFKTASISTNG